MDHVLVAWEARLRQVDDELREREQQVVAEEPSPDELLALAAEHDRIATTEDTIAGFYDDEAAARDRSGLRRDVAGSSRDRRARSSTRDFDPAFLDRALAGGDRDFAAGDRGDSHGDRARGRAARQRAAGDRARAADERERARDDAVAQAQEVDGLRAALESRLVIGQAQGLLMARHNVLPDAAFAILVRLSQARNAKLRDVAAALVATFQADRE